VSRQRSLSGKGSLGGWVLDFHPLTRLNFYLKTDIIKGKNTSMKRYALLYFVLMEVVLWALVGCQPVIKRPALVSVKNVGSGPPGWIESADRVYPIGQYITGVGSGVDRTSAEDRARAEIAKTLHSRITSVTKVYEAYTQTTTTGKTRSSDQISIQDMTEVSTQTILSGVRIAEVAQDTSRGEPTYYALAVLDRRQSRVMLGDRIRSLDQQILSLVRQAENEPQTLGKIKHLKAALRLYISREVYNAELSVVDPSGRGLAPVIGFEKIQDPLSKLLRNDLFIAIAVSGDNAREIRQSLAGALNQKGFSITKDENRCNVLVKGTVEISPIDRKSDQWKFVRWNTHFSLIDKSQGAIFWAAHNTGREGHKTTAQARQRAVMKIEQKIVSNIAGQMTQFIFSRPADRLEQ
jgi:LPP20 lipoprotein